MCEKKKLQTSIPNQQCRWNERVSFFFRKLLDNGNCNERILYLNKHFTCSTLCVQHILIAMRTMQLIQFVYFQYRIYLFSTWDKLFRRWVAWYQIGIKIQKNRRNEPTRYHLHISRFFISSKWTAKLLFWLFYLPFHVWFYRIFISITSRTYLNKVTQKLTVLGNVSLFKILYVLIYVCKNRAFMYNKQQTFRWSWIGQRHNFFYVDHNALLFQRCADALYTTQLKNGRS